MNFLRRLDDYETMYTKRTAIKMLKEEPRIEKIINRKKSITIHTNPIIPRFPSRSIPKYPIGTYKIIVSEFSKSFKIKITRKEGKLYEPRAGSHHPHICDEFNNLVDGTFTDQICWGNIAREIATIKRNKDLYWLVKRLLDLLCDFHGEYDYVCYAYQRDFIIKNKYKVDKKHIRMYEDYEDDDEEEDGDDEDEITAVAISRGEVITWGS